VADLRRALLVLGALALLAAAIPPVEVSVGVTRADDGLLSPVTITIGLRNPQRSTLTASFLTTDLYEVQVRDGDSELYSSLFGHKPIEIERRIPLPPGLTSLGSLVWDATTNDHRSLAPGTYTLRVSILGSLIHPSAEIPIAFATPLPVASAKALKPGTAVTLAGSSVLIGGVPTLIGDDGATLRLSRLARPRAQGRYIFRGYITKIDDSLELAVERAAPAFENLTPEAARPSPQPLMSASSR
jgi:hypothetical protein